MKLESTGILIGLRPFGERDMIAHIFTRDFGVMLGMLRGGAIARKNRPLAGQVGLVSWNARLDSQLGVFHWEASRNLAAPLMANRKALATMNSAFALIAALLPEREKYEKLYDQTEDLLQELAGLAPPPAEGNAYLSWEVELLRELGYALDLTRCSNCGCAGNLHYLSPRTGRAVCDECAAPYLDRLHRLPLSLDVTRQFLEKICEAQGAKLPPARKLVTCDM